MPIDEATKRPAARPQPDETLETALKRIRFTPTPKQPTQRPSAYFTEIGEAEFQQGATIVPHVLTIAETTSPAARRDRIRVTTRKSSKPPWNTVEPRTIKVPKHWLIDLFSSSTVPSFAARSSRKAIIPMDGGGNLLNEDDITEEGWLLLNDLYTAHAGAEKNTPTTLLQQLANRRKLTAQLPLRRGTRRNLVLCPKSGDIMRAARTHVGNAVADDTLYWYQAARRARVARVSDELRRNGVDVQPVHIEGRTIARSFWGRRWRHHLESCSDFENRLPRGRVYVRNGSVCHLDVHAGGVDAMVVGSDLYHVVVRIRKLGQAAWKTIRAECAGRVGSVLELLQGRLSDHVLRVVTDPDRGLFPKPGEITLTCDCPDWAVMCKHAAAVLYGVGSRLDDRPELLFRLRDVDAEDLVVGDMALPDAAAGDDVLAGDLADIFGIDLDPADSGAAAARQKTTGRRRPRRGRPRRTGAPPSGFQPTGRRVAELRRRGGFSVPEFASLLRVSASTVYRWEAARGPLALRAGQEDALQVLYRAIEKRQT